MQRKKTDHQRFWEKVQKTDGCWLWTGAKDKDGYGLVAFQCKTTRATRVAWIMANGSIDPKLCVLHRCDNPSCVRIDHLFLGSHLDNHRDMDAKGRRYDERGEKNHRSALTRDDVLMIRRLDDYLPREQIGRLYGITTAHTGALCTGRRWGHVREGIREKRSVVCNRKHSS